MQVPAQTATIEEVTSPTVAQPMAAEPSPAQSVAVEPSAAQSDVQPQQRSSRPRVTFADDVQGGEEQVSPLQPVNTHAFDTICYLLIEKYTDRRPCSAGKNSPQWSPIANRA